jgi:hypothetical protein
MMTLHWLLPRNDFRRVAKLNTQDTEREENKNSSWRRTQRHGTSLQHAQYCTCCSTTKSWLTINCRSHLLQRVTSMLDLILFHATRPSPLLLLAVSGLLHLLFLVLSLFTLHIHTLVGHAATTVVAMNPLWTSSTHQHAPLNLPLSLQAAVKRPRC